MPALTSLDGLPGFADLERAELDTLPRLAEVSPLRALRTAEQVTFARVPLLGELEAIDQLESVDDLRLEETAVTGLASLGALTHIRALELVANPGLTSLTALPPLPTLDSLRIDGNPVLPNLSGLESVTALSWLAVSGGVLADLTGLDNVASASEVTIYATPVTSLHGFEALRQTNRIDLIDNDQLGDLSALAGLAQIDYRLSIDGAPALHALSGLEAQRSFVLLQLSRTGLLSLDGLSGLTGLGALGLDDNPQLARIDALGGVSQIYGDLVIARCPQLASLHGLEAVGQAGTRVVLSDLAALNSLSGLSGLTWVFGLELAHLPLLTSFDGLQAVSTAYYLSAHDNAALASVTSLTHLASLPDGLSLYDNPALSHCNAELLAARMYAFCSCPLPDPGCDGSCTPRVDGPQCPRCEQPAECSCSGRCDCTGNDNAQLCL
jgi:hypothetical protein